MTKYTKTTTTTGWKANDGEEFLSEFQCMLYEWRKYNALVMYAVSTRGQRSDEPEIYSTKNFADEAVYSRLEPRDFIITEVYVNERIMVNRFHKEIKDRKAAL